MHGEFWGNHIRSTVNSFTSERTHCALATVLGGLNNGNGDVGSVLPLSTSRSVTGLGAVLCGPSGSGKSELLRGLSSSLGRNLVAFNCRFERRICA